MYPYENYKLRYVILYCVTRMDLFVTIIVQIINKKIKVIYFFNC